MFEEIPDKCPETALLDRIESPADLRQLEKKQLPQLAEELRTFLLYTIGQTGGHFGANLGTVELTIALHYLYDTPTDRLVWDVGHQAYPHKVLTGRRKQMSSLRQRDGLAGFLKRGESPYDVFGAGHSSTSISAALGMALAARLQGQKRRVVAIIGDGGMTAGMAYEAMAHAGATGASMLVVLNDNQMSISRNIGGLHNYFARIWASRLYIALREGGQKVLSRMPAAWKLARRTEEHVKGMVAPGTLFEELGLNYIGPIDGHNLKLLVSTLRNMRDRPGPQLLHILTVKGKGYAPAEKDPIKHHAIAKIEKPKAAAPQNPTPKYQQIFGDWLCDTAAREPRLAAITPAMCEGSGMTEYAKKYPQRFFDVAIAEQHSVTLAAGLASEGMKPVVAIYSTFLQRAYDQLIHDVALQNLDVLFAVDRAGLVGEDGPTHAGSFDLSYLRTVPNLVIMTPSDGEEMRRLLDTGFLHAGPAVVRYPRGGVPAPVAQTPSAPIPLGKALLLREGRQVAILAFGPLLGIACKVGEAMDASVANMRFVKPLDQQLILRLADSHELLVTVEDNALAGGAGTAVSQLLVQNGVHTSLLHLGIPDYFVEHASRNEQLAECGLDEAGITRSIKERLQ